MQSSLKYSLLSISILASAAHAQEEFRQHEAHVHGVVEFNIAQDGNELLVEITAPGADVVGFEHAIENEQQHEQIMNARHILQQANNIIMLSSAADCEVEHVHVETNITDEHSDHHDDHDDHDHADEHHDDHDKHDHADEHHDDHHDHDEHDHEHGEHGSFTIEYHFECGDIAKLNQIETSWFNHFPNTEKVNVNLLTDTMSKAVELNSQSNTIKL